MLQWPPLRMYGVSDVNWRRDKNEWLLPRLSNTADQRLPR